MKKKMLMMLAGLFLIAGVAAVTASAEENGYWTQKPDESGNLVWIFTYTEPVEIEILPDAESGCLLEDAVPISGTASADTRLAAPAEVAAPVVETTAQPAAVPGNSAASLITFGVLFLAATGFVLYKAI